MNTEKFTVVRSLAGGRYPADGDFPVETEKLPAPPAEREAAWHANFHAAVAANLARQPMGGTDPLTECLVDEALAFTYARERARAEPNATGVTGPVIVPVGRVARWWLTFKNWI